MGGRNRQSDTLYLKCVQCGAVITMRDEVLLDEIARRRRNRSGPERISYQPSGEVVRLTNAINRGWSTRRSTGDRLPDLAGGRGAVRLLPRHNGTNRPPAGCVLGPYPLAVSHINLSEEGTVEAAFHPATGKDRTWSRLYSGGADHPRQEGY